jgi:ribosomal-protein-alanine N-acetyltransferase
MVTAISTASPEAASWNRPAYEAMLRDPLHGRVLVACDGDRVVAFLCMRVAAGEAEVLNLAVDPAFRRRHIASRLLEQGLRLAVAEGARRVFLEVRKTNQAALRLYGQFGFGVVGERPGYYEKPPEDAVVLARTLPLAEPLAG